MTQRQQKLQLSKIRRVTTTLTVALVAVLVFAILMSLIAVMHAFGPEHILPSYPISPPQKTPVPMDLIVTTVVSYSLPLSLSSWVCVLGLLVWRGRVRSIWTSLGFDQDVFRLFVRMKGAPTRLKLLQSLASPKDRAQLAEELDIDWKAVDRHIWVLEKYGFVKEEESQGTAKFYELTPSGNILLNLIEEEQQ